jgi:HK97 family phage major capsid protein
MAQPDSLGADLQQYLLTTIYNTPAEDRRSAAWVMSHEWWNECRRMTDANHNPLWQPARSPAQPDCLFGYPVTITEDGGAPHLVKA